MAEPAATAATNHIDRVAAKTNRPCSKTRRSYLKRKWKSDDSTGSAIVALLVHGFTSEGQHIVGRGRETALRQFRPTATSPTKTRGRLFQPGARVEHDVCRSRDNNRRHGCRGHARPGRAIPARSSYQ